MSVADLLVRYRALGGVADNVRLSQGAHGWGVFVLDPQRPVRVLTPSCLLIAPADLRLTEQGQIQVRPEAALSPEIVSFHEAYQRELGWGAGGLACSMQQHRLRQALPKTLQPFLRLLGGHHHDVDEVLPPQQAFEAHCVSRQIGVDGRSRLMPVLELINHAPDGAAYVVDQGISLTGRFKDEVLACYRRQMDAFHFFFGYHFASPARVVLSCEVTIDLPELGVLSIARNDGMVEQRQGVSAPCVTRRPCEIQLSFVELANHDAPARPREVFVALMAAQGLAVARSHELFDGLIAHHRQVLQAFVQACEIAAVNGDADIATDTATDIDTDALTRQLQQIAQGQLSSLDQSS